MFYVFEYSVFYPCCKYEIREGTSSSLLPGGFGTYMDQTVRRVTPRTSLHQQAVIEGRGSSKFFQIPLPI